MVKDFRPTQQDQAWALICPVADCKVSYHVRLSLLDVKLIAAGVFQFGAGGMPKYHGTPKVNDQFDTERLKRAHRLTIQHLEVDHHTYFNGLVEEGHSSMPFKHIRVCIGFKTVGPRSVLGITRCVVLIGHVTACPGLLEEQPLQVMGPGNCAGRARGLRG